MTRKLPQDHGYLNRLAPTPLVPIRLSPSEPTVWAKLEFLNPSGSTKDRIARYILAKAWREGRIGPGSLVAEASSGSTSIAMALVCAQLGVRFIAAMPEGVSNERALMIRAYGGEIRFTPQGLGIAGAIAETERLRAELGAFLPCQFSNAENAEAHETGTAREILDQIPGGAVDAVVSGVGTGGTLVGLWRGVCGGGCRAGAFLARPVSLQAGAADVECCSFSCRIPGVVECMSSIFRPDQMPGCETIEVHEEEAIRITRELIRRGFPVGPSSGLNFAAAMEAFRRLNDPSAQVVTVFPDRMERYFTTDLFAAWRTS